MENFAPILSLSIAAAAIFVDPMISWKIAKRQIASSMLIAREGIMAPVRHAWTVDLRDLLAQLSSKTLPHTLRHSFATDLYRETTNIRLTQKALGHSNLATTQIYTHIVDEELEGALKSFHTAKVGA